MLPNDCFDGFGGLFHPDGGCWLQYYKKIYEKEVVGIAKDFPDLFPGNVLSYR